MRRRREARTIHSYDGASIVPPDVEQFLNSIPSISAPFEWCMQFRTALMILCPDFERIGVHLAFQPWAPLSDEEGALGQPIPDTCEAGTSGPYIGWRRRFRSMSMEDRVTSLLEQISYSGVDLGGIGRPICRTFQEHHGAEAGGVIILLPGVNLPFPSRALDCLDQIRPFIASQFADARRRYLLTRPALQLAGCLLARIEASCALSAMECDVLDLWLQGMPLVQIAEHAGCSRAGVKRHLAGILRKSGCTTHDDLIAVHIHAGRERERGRRSVSNAAIAF